ncbi:hypothetical protein VQ042_22265 [Aurantimonas sp. A2-1-M11]|uniref:hypothetical protein n=1 Tax=Aurantimonas sp. A2-1-M11 TaxID=3113712 RepID=UPI002F92374D
MGTITARKRTCGTTGFTAQILRKKDWAVGNLVMMRDKNDRRANKARAAGRIDPAVSAIMSVSRAVASASGRSIYESDASEELLLF